MTENGTQVQKTRETILTRIAGLKTQLEHISRENVELGKMYKQSRVEVDELQNLKSKLKKDLRQAEKKGIELDEEIHELKDQLRDHSKIQSELTTLRPEHEELKVRHEQLQVRHEQLVEQNARVQEDRDKLAEKQERLLEKLNRLEDEIAELEENRSQIQSELDAITGEQEQMLGDLGEIESVIGDIKGEMVSVRSGYEEDITQLGTVDAILREELERVQEKVDETLARCEALEEENEKLRDQQELKSSENRILELTEKIEEIKKNAAEQENELQNKIAQRNAEIEELEIEITRLKNELKDREKQIDGVVASSNDMDELKEELRQKEGVLEEARLSLQRKEELEAQNVEQKERITALENELSMRIQKAEKDFAEQKNRADSLIAQRDQTITKLEEERTKLEEEKNKALEQIHGVLQSGDTGNLVTATDVEELTRNMIPKEEYEKLTLQLEDLRAESQMISETTDTGLYRNAVEEIRDHFIKYEELSENAEDGLALLMDTFESVVSILERTSPRNEKEASNSREKENLTAVVPEEITEEVAAELLGDQDSLDTMAAADLLDDVEKAYKELLGE